jgi:hypothetical protein
MDLLDRVSTKAGDQAQTHQLGLLKFKRGQAPSMLLAGMPPSLTLCREPDEILRVRRLGTAHHRAQDGAFDEWRGHKQLEYVGDDVPDGCSVARDPPNFVVARFGLSKAAGAN